MSTLHLVHPELVVCAEDNLVPEMNAVHLAEMRKINPSDYLQDIETPNLTFTEQFVPGREGAPDVRVLVYQPSNLSGQLPAILHIHGGGYVIGAPEMNDATNRQLAVDLGAVVVSVDYRLPPEHPYPAPLEDCYAVLAWMHQNAETLAIDPSRVAIKGESAGGGLAAGLALLARDRGQFPIAYQCLIYPMIDDRPPTEPHPYTGEFVWNAKSNHFGWQSYLGQAPGSADVPVYAAPARASSEALTGLPPTFIYCGGLDLFLEEDMDYAKALMRAGVAVELIIYPGAYHGFHLAGDTTLSRRSDQDVLNALSAAFAKD